MGPRAASNRGPHTPRHTLTGTGTRRNSPRSFLWERRENRLEGYCTGESRGHFSPRPGPRPLRPLFLIPSPNRVPSPGKVPIGFPILPQPPRPFSSSCLGPAHSVLGPPLNPASHLGGWMLPGCSIYPPTSVCAQDAPLRPRPAPPTDSASAEPLAPPHNLPVPTRVRSLAPPLPRGSPEAALRSYPGCRQFRRPRGRGSRTGNAGRGRGERVSGRSWSKAEQDGGVGLRLA